VGDRPIRARIDPPDAAAGKLARRPDSALADSKAPGSVCDLDSRDNPRGLGIDPDEYVVDWIGGPDGTAADRDSGHLDRRRDRGHDLAGAWTQAIDASRVTVPSPDAFPPCRNNGLFGISGHGWTDARSR